MNRLKELRKEKKLTQKELADIIGTTKLTISNWENDKHSMNSEKAKVLADYFGVSVGYLLGNTDNSKVYDDETIIGMPDSVFTWSNKRIIDENNRRMYQDFLNFFRDNKIIISDNVIDSLYQLIQAQDIGRGLKDKNFSSIQLNKLLYQDFDSTIESLAKNGFSYIYSDKFQRTETEYLIHRYVISESETEQDRLELLQVLKKHYGERSEYKKDYRNGI